MTGLKSIGIGCQLLKTELYPKKLIVEALTPRVIIFGDGPLRGNHVMKLEPL